MSEETILPLLPYSMDNYERTPFFRSQRIIVAEKEFIGGILNAPWALDQLTHPIGVEDLNLAYSKMIFEVTREFLDLGIQFNAADVMQRIITQGDYQKDLPAFFSECLSLDPTGMSVFHRSQLLRESSILRQLWSTAQELSNKAEYPEDEADLIAHDFIERFQKVIEAESGGPVPLSIVLNELQHNIDLRTRGQSAEPVLTGLGKIDDLTNGFYPGEFIVIGARPSVGKTSLGLQIAEQCIKADIPILFFSLEMDRVMLAERFLLFEGVDYSIFKAAKLQPNQIEKVTSTCSKIESLPLYIDHGSGLKLSQIQSRTRYFKRNYKIGAVIIDYLQLIQSDRRDQTEYEHVTNISKTLKNMSKQIQLPVIALAQLNRETDKRGNGRPRLSDLRSSGQIEQDADKVILLHRERDNEEKMSPNGIISVEKSRNGQTGQMYVIFHGPTMRFLDKETRNF